MLKENIDARNIITQFIYVKYKIMFRMTRRVIRIKSSVRFPAELW